MSTSNVKTPILLSRKAKLLPTGNSALKKIDPLNLIFFSGVIVPISWELQVTISLFFPVITPSPSP